MFKFNKIILALVGLLLTSACTTNNGHYKAISNKPISLYSINNYNTIVAKKAIATDSRHVIVIIPSGKNPTISDAVGEILTKYNGDYLTNASINRKSFQLMWMYHYTAWEIEGDVVRINK